MKSTAKFSILAGVMALACSPERQGNVSGPYKGQLDKVGTTLKWSKQQ